MAPWKRIQYSFPKLAFSGSILVFQGVTVHLLLSPFNFHQGNEYTFTVLSLRHMSITLNALADAPFVPYRAKVHSYSSDVVRPDGVDELVLTPGP